MPNAWTRTQAEVAAALYRAANLLLSAIRAIVWPFRAKPSHAKSVCIYRIGNIGDIVCALPAMAAIRSAYPHAQLTLLTSPGTRGMPGAAEILFKAPWLDRQIVYYQDEISNPSRKMNLIRRLRQERFDVWIELPNDLATLRTSVRNMVFAKASGARWACGWKINTLRFAAQAQSLHRNFPNEVDRLLGMLAQVSIRPGKVSFPIPIGDAHERAVDSILRSHGYDGAPIIAIAPGAKRPLNRWPEERFALVGQHGTKNGFSITVLGAEPDRPACDFIARRIGPRAINLAGKTSLLESAALLKRCSLLVCNDSGLQHLAAAVGTQCVSLFSFWQLRGKWHPYGPGHRVLQKWVVCHTCFRETCPFENRCLNLNEAEEVIRIIDSISHRESDAR